MREGLRGAPGEKHGDFPYEAPQRSKRRDRVFGGVRRVGAVDQKDHRTASCVMEDHVDDGVPVLGGHGVAGGILAGVVEEHEGTSLLVEAFAEGAVEGWYVEGTGVVEHAERHDPSPGLVGDRVVRGSRPKRARPRDAGPAARKRHTGRHEVRQLGEPRTPPVAEGARPYRARPPQTR